MPVAGGGSLVIMVLVVGICHGLTQGPCPTHPLSTVHVDVNKWAGDLYVNVETFNEEARCQWASRRIGFKNGSVVLIDQLQFIEKNNESAYEVEGRFVSEGYYVFDAEVIPGRNTTFHAYFLHFDPPNLDCHIVCTNDPYFKDGHFELYCESQYPDAVKSNAPLIREIAEKNNIDVRGLMIVDNCNCPNIPYLRGKSKCKNVSVEDYFSLEPEDHCTET